MARQREALETTALLKQIEIGKIGSDISSSEDELLLGDNYSPIERKNGGPSNVLALVSTKPKAASVKIEKDDDQMSLSSLSDNEQKIEESKVAAIPPLMSQIAQPPYPYQQYPGECFKS